MSMGRSAAEQIGYASFPLILLAITAFIGWRMGKKRQPPKFVAWPIGVAAILLVLSFVGRQIMKQPDDPPPFGDTRR